MKTRIYAAPAVKWLRPNVGQVLPTEKHLHSLTQARIYHCRLHPPQAANCCRISQLVVYKDDLMWVKNLKKLPCIGKRVSWKYSF